MAEITLVLTDTPAGGVAVRTTYTPAIGQTCTPAQARSLDMLRLARHEGDTVTGDAPELPNAAAAERDVLAVLLARCLDPLRNVLAEGSADRESDDELRSLIERAEAALQHLALRAIDAQHQPGTHHLEWPTLTEVVA